MGGFASQGCKIARHSALATTRQSRATSPTLALGSVSQNAVSTSRVNDQRQNQTCGEKILEAQKQLYLCLSNTKHCKNCECCPRHSLLKGHNVIVNIVVLNCQKCNQCLKCQVSYYKGLGLLFEGVLLMSLSFPKI